MSGTNPMRATEQFSPIRVCEVELSGRLPIIEGEQTARVLARWYCEPLALVVVIEVGGDGARQLAKYESLTAMIDSIVGGVPQKVAVVGCDSSPVLV